MRCEPNQARPIGAPDDFVIHMATLAATKR